MSDSSPITPLALGAMIFAAVAPYIGRIVSALVKLLEGFQATVDSWNLERKLRIDTYREFIEEIKRRDTLYVEATKSHQETIRLSNEQAQHHADDRASWKADMAQIVQQVVERDTTIELLTKENQRLKPFETKCEELLKQVSELQDKIKEYESGKISTVESKEGETDVT